MTWKNTTERDAYTTPIRRNGQQKRRGPNFCLIQEKQTGNCLSHDGCAKPLTLAEATPIARNGLDLVQQAPILCGLFLNCRRGRGFLLKYRSHDLAFLTCFSRGQHTSIKLFTNNFILFFHRGNCIAVPLSVAKLRLGLFLLYKCVGIHHSNTVITYCFALPIVISNRVLLCALRQL